MLPSRRPVVWVILLVIIVRIATTALLESKTTQTISCPVLSYATPQVTVIIPVRNREKLLDRCLASVEKQTFKQIEILVIDDCSTDRSLEIAREHQRKDPRIRIIALHTLHKTNILRVLGVRMAHGRYILFLDSDDELIDTVVEKDLKVAIKERCEIVEHKAYKSRNGQIGEFKWKRPRFSVADGATVQEHFILDKLNWNLWRKLVSRDLYVRALDLLGDEYCNAEIRWGEDMMHCAALFKLVTKYVVTDDYGYIYYTYGSDSSGTMSRSEIESDTMKVTAAIDRLYPKSEYPLRK